MSKKESTLDEITIIPIINKKKIKKLMQTFDSEFRQSVLQQPEHSGLLDKISQNAVVFGICFKMQMVGYTAVYMNDYENGIAYITLFVVAEKYRARHIGKKLMDYVKFTAKVNGFNKIRLEVAESNRNAIIFYEHNAFQYEKRASAKSDYFVCEI